MVTLGELQAEVEQRYAVLGLPAWPDPHPDRTEVGDEEYSRLTQPERYRVVHVRGRIWAEVLEAALGVAVSELSGEPMSRTRLGFDRGLRLSPDRAGTLPLFLLERDVPTESDASLAVLHLAVARPDLVVASEPDCGCDACDSGSADLLASIDATIGHVVGGPYVVLRGPQWHAEWHPDGGSAGSDGTGPDFRMLMELCRRLAAGEQVELPDGAEAFVGRSWIDADARG